MSSINKNIAYQTIYKLVISLSPLITTPYLNRVLGADGLGFFSFRQSIVNFFMLFAMLGISNYGIRTVARTKNDPSEMIKHIWAIYSIQLFSTFTMLLLYGIYILTFAPDGKVIMLILSFYLIGNLFDINWFFYGIEDIKVMSVRGIVVKILTIISVFLFIRTKQDLWKYVLIIVGGNALGLITVWPLFLKKANFVLPKWECIKSHIKPIMILFIPLAAVSIYHIMDKIMLGWFSDDLNSGYYYSADKVINIPIVVITGVHAVFLPRISNLIAQTKDASKMQRNAMLLTLVLVSSMAGGIAAVSEDFVPVFFGGGYAPCVSLIRIFALVMLAKSLSSVMCNAYIIPYQKDFIYVVSVIIGAVVNFFANIVLIYLLGMGAVGATLGTLLAELCVAVAEIMLVIKKIQNHGLHKEIIRGSYFILSGVVMFMIIRMLKQFCLANEPHMIALVVEILVGVLFYLLVVIIYIKVCGIDYKSLINLRNGAKQD